MKINKITALALVVATIFTLTACSQTDVVAKDSVRAFGEIIDAIPAREYEQGRWVIQAPDGTAWFSFDNTSVSMVVDAAAFVAAGLEPSKLENTGEHALNVGRDSIFFTSPSVDMLNQNAKDSPLLQFEDNIKSLREYLGYHTALDHYGIELGGGMFEWAKDIAKNDKDIVFVLDPQPFIDAGVKVDSIEGFVVAKVETMVDGKTVEVDRLLKPFNVR